MRLQPPNISGMPTIHDNHEYDKQRSRTYIDPAERPYVPEPKWTPLSESPARELPLVEESYAHGPYRAENSPTPSMQVHVDRDDFVLAKGNEPLKASRQYEPQPSQQNDRTWTRYVTVKEYRDEKGPFVEVEEKFVFNDERWCVATLSLLYMPIVDCFSYDWTESSPFPYSLSENICVLSLIVSLACDFEKKFWWDVGKPAGFMVQDVDRKEPLRQDVLSVDHKESLLPWLQIDVEVFVHPPTPLSSFLQYHL
jgi:hypothetical protein